MSKISQLSTFFKCAQVKKLKGVALFYYEHEKTVDRLGHSLKERL